MTGKYEGKGTTETRNGQASFFILFLQYKIWYLVNWRGDVSHGISVWRETHISQVLIPRATNNTNIYGTVTDLKTNTPDKKSRSIWGVMSIVRRVSYLSFGDLRVCSLVIVIPLKVADPVWYMVPTAEVVLASLWRYWTLRTRRTSARALCPYCG